jgi:hypothetical protein
MSLGRAVLKTLSLPPRERRRAVEAAVELARASLELRLVPSSRTVALLGRPRQGVPDEGVDPGRLREAERVGAAVAAVAGRLPWRPTCLRQALAAQRMLRRRGIPAHLHLGVTGPEEGRAHAWVTVCGRAVVGQPGHERFVPLAMFG